jgi:hypothetical protein
MQKSKHKEHELLVVQVRRRWEEERWREVERGGERWREGERGRERETEGEGKVEDIMRIFSRSLSNRLSAQQGP